MKLSFIINFLEITSLLLLTYVSSREYHYFHALFFCIFLMTSALYMLLICVSYFYKQQITSKEVTKLELKSRNSKIILLLIYLTSFLTSLYFYIRHNIYCEPYIFSYFSLCEYITVLTNITFHSLVLKDLDLFKNSYKIKIISIKNEKKFP